MFIFIEAIINLNAEEVVQKVQDDYIRNEMVTTNELKSLHNQLEKKIKLEPYIELVSYLSSFWVS